MIFLLAKDLPALFLMLSEKDIGIMRPGRTLFVDQRQLGGRTFDRVILSLGKTDAENLELVQKAQPGMDMREFVSPEPARAEARCKGCEAIVEACTLFEERCIVCWATEAKKLRTARN